MWKILNPGKHLFDGMPLPKVFTADFLYRLILLEYGEMEVLYKNTPDFYNSVLMFWEKNTPMFDKLAETTEYEYDPLVDTNYASNRVEHGKNKKNTVENQRLANQGSDKNNGKDDKTGDIKDYVSAYNQGNGESLKDHRVTSDGDIWNDAGEFENSGTRDLTNDFNGEWGTETDYKVKGLKNHTTQDLIEQERKLAMFHVEDVILKYWASEVMVAMW